MSTHLNSMKKFVLKLKLVLIFSTILNVWIQILFLPLVISLQYRFLPLPNESYSTKTQKASTVLVIAQALTPQHSDTQAFYSLPLSVPEYQHLFTVSQLLFRHQILCVIISIVTICFFCSTPYVVITRTDLTRFFTSILVIVSTCLALALLWWETFFIQFHTILFPDGNWSFPDTSTLIQLFPDRFWQIMVVEVFVCSVITLLFMGPILIHDKISE